MRASGRPAPNTFKFKLPQPRRATTAGLIFMQDLCKAYVDSNLNIFKTLVIDHPGLPAPQTAMTTGSKSALGKLPQNNKAMVPSPTKRQIAMAAANQMKSLAANLAKKAVQAKNKAPSMTVKTAAAKLRKAKQVARAKAEAKIAAANAKSWAGTPRPPASPKTLQTPPRKGKK
jgi:hypothetical protein